METTAAHPTARTVDTPAQPVDSSALDVIALGELLVDLSQVGADPQTGAALLQRNPGGAPANVAVAASKLGLRTAFAGKVGRDPQGAFLAERLAGHGVDTSGVVFEANACTTLAFATVDPATSWMRYSFVRKPGADQLLRVNELDLAAIERARVLHVGSFSLSHEPARSAVLAAIDRARWAGTLVSCDPNHRPLVWDASSGSTPLEQMAALVARADLLKVNRDEAELLTGSSDAPAAAADLLRRGPRFVAVTLDEHGAYLATRGEAARIPAFPATVRDTTGAGDAFWGAALAWLLGERKVRQPGDLDTLTADDLQECGRFACAAASVCVERPGGMTASPTRAELEARLR